MRTRLAHKIAALFALFTSLASAGPRHQLTGPGFKNVAYFNETISLLGVTSTSVKVGPLTSSSSGYGLQHLSVSKDGGQVDFSLPVIWATRPTTSAAALTSAGMWVDRNIPTFKVKMANWLLSQGVSSGIVNFTQEIEVPKAGTVVRKKIAFNMTIDAHGRVTYGAPKIIDEDPSVLEVLYIPAAMKAQLPAELNYPDAGILKWRIISAKDRTVLTDWKAVQTGGAFDEPPQTNAATAAIHAEQEKGLHCLMDATKPGCPAFPIDVKNLMASTETSFSVVTYLRSIEPAYQKNADGSNGPPKFTLAISERTWDCETFKNTGQYGIELYKSGDQYLAQPAASGISYSLVNQIGGPVPIDMQAGVAGGVSYTAQLSAEQLAGVSKANIDKVILPPPQAGTEPYWLTSDATKKNYFNISNIAPLQQPTGNPNSVIPTLSYPFNGSAAQGLLDDRTLIISITFPDWESSGTAYFSPENAVAQESSLYAVSGSAQVAFGGTALTASHSGTATVYVKVKGLCNAEPPKVLNFAMQEPPPPPPSGGGGRGGSYGGCDGCSQGAVTSGDGSSVSSGDGGSVTSSSGGDSSGGSSGGGD
jgi:hypothetical protein